MTIETRLEKIAEKDGTTFLLEAAIEKVRTQYRKPMTPQEYQVYASTVTMIYEKKKRLYKEWCGTRYMTNNKGW